MNKKSIISIVLALSLILVGTGYAYWTDTLNVTTKATTGDLDVTFVDLGLYAQYGNEYAAGTSAAENWSIIDGIGATGFVAADYFGRETNYNAISNGNDYRDRADGYNNVNFEAELVNAAAIKATVGPYAQGSTMGSDNILLTVENIYPGYAQAFRTDIANVGSIAAKLGNVNFDVKGADKNHLNKETKNMLGVAVLIEREQYTQPGAVEGANVFELAKLFDKSDIFTLGNVDFVRLSALEDLKAKFNADNNNLMIMPNDNRMDLYIAIAMDPDAKGVYTTGSTSKMNNKNDDSNSQLKGATISMDLLWDQFNAGTKVDATNILEEQNRSGRR